jgi:aminopeptidase-like protein
VNIVDLKSSVDGTEVGRDMYKLIAELYPICRSITGNGFRQTIEILRRFIPLYIHEVPSGTKVFDWAVPKEWNIKDAYIKNSKGERVVDFLKSNLHVLNYSIPVKKIIPLRELREHLFTLPDHPDWIPYRTSYYEENWGFCLSHNQLMEMKDEDYEVCIDSSLEDGHLTYGEYYIKGEKTDEVLFSCHACHPSLCNDNLSGVALTTFLAKYLSSLSLRYSYRFLFIPGTIGSIAWLCINEAGVSRIKHGLVVACVGDSGRLTYKKSRREDAEIDKAVTCVLKHSGEDHEIKGFSPYGYDERQFCSPGFNLPVGSLTRTPHGHFPQYHTSADDLNFVEPEHLADSLSKCLSVVHILENNRRYLNQNQKCEPQLGRRGLYRTLGGVNEATNELAMLWVLNLSDGHHTLLDISERSGLNFALLNHMGKVLREKGLLEEYAD